MDCLGNAFHVYKSFLYPNAPWLREYCSLHFWEKMMVKNCENCIPIQCTLQNMWKIFETTTQIPKWLNLLYLRFLDITGSITFWQSGARYSATKGLQPIHLSPQQPHEDWSRTVCNMWKTSSKFGYVPWNTTYSQTYCIYFNIDRTHIKTHLYIFRIDARTLQYYVVWTLLIRIYLIQTLGLTVDGTTCRRVLRFYPKNSWQD